MKQIFIVEGIHDVDRLKKYNPTLHVVSVNGSAIDPSTLEYLEKISETRQMILCLDPDHAGERIRRILSKKLKNVAHVFLPKEKAVSSNGKKIGFEHVTDDTLIEALSHIQVESNEPSDEITDIFLHEVGLTGSTKSRSLREKLSKYFNLGHVNGKQLKVRLNSFNITKEDILKVLECDEWFIVFFYGEY